MYDVVRVVYVARVGTTLRNECVDARLCIYFVLFYFLFHLPRRHRRIVIVDVVHIGRWHTVNSFGYELTIVYYTCTLGKGSAAAAAGGGGLKACFIFVSFRLEDVELREQNAKKHKTSTGMRANVCGCVCGTERQCNFIQDSVKAAHIVLFFIC